MGTNAIFSRCDFAATDFHSCTLYSAALCILRKKLKDISMRPIWLAMLPLGILAGIGPSGAADWTGWSIGLSGGGGTGSSAQTDFWSSLHILG